MLNPNRFTSLPDAVLLDTDNTLYPYEPAHSAASRALMTKAMQTLSISESEFNKAYELARQDVKKRLGHVAAAHSRLLYSQRLLELLGLGSQVLLALDLEQTYWRTFLANAELFPGVTALLDDLRLLGIPTAIITDLTAQIQFRKMVYFDLDSFIDHIVTSEEAGADKPDPAPFQLAIEKLRPQGNNVWMIGDNPEADIAGARRAIGATTLQKLHQGVQRGSGEQVPDAEFKDYQEIQDLLAKLTVER